MTTPQIEAAGSIRDDIDAIVSSAQARLGEQSVSALGGRPLRGVLAVLKRADDYDDLERKLERLNDDLDGFRAVLQMALDETKAAEAAWVNKERFGEAWWKHRRREVEEAFRKGPDDGRRQWLATYAEALAAARFDVCHQMTLGDWPSPDGVDMFRTGAAALQGRRYRDAVESLEMLAEESKLLPDVATRAAVLVFLGRIYLYELSNLTVARRWVDRALEWAQDDGRAWAVLGECRRVGGELDRAQESFTRAIQISPQLPDGYIGTALLCEDRHWFHRALDWYDDAIDAAGEVPVFGQLLAPAPGGLYWQLARRLRKQDPARALDAIDRALERGVRWSHEHPERKPLADRGAILEVLGRSEEAAEAYFESGRRYSWLENQRKARQLLEKACRLDPMHPIAHWQLAESLRVLSYGRTAPFVIPELVELSRKRWETGSAVRSPDASTAWAYLSRALLNEQRWKLDKDPEVLWESLVFLECALLLSESYATAWAYLGQYHRILGNFESALHATEQALSIDPMDLGALEQRAAVLADVGRYAEAEQAVDRRLERAEEWWAITIKAYVLLRTDRVEEALELAERAISAVSDDQRYRSLRALCLDVLGQVDRSKEDCRWIWDRRGTEQAKLWAPHSAAWAGYMLGEFDAAADLLEAALEENSFESTVLTCGLGQVRLARGDPARNDIVEGELALERAIGMMRNAGQLHDTLDLDLPVLERKLRTRSDAEAALAALARVRSRAEEAHDALARSVTTPDGELRAIAESAPADSNQWLAAQAGMARAAGAAEHWTKALERYVTLTTSGSFPEADVGLAHAIGKLQHEADERVGQGRVAEAREQLQALLPLAEEHLGDQADVTFDLRVRAGFAGIAQSDDEAARQHLGRVLSSGRGVQSRLDELASLEESFIRTPADYWTHVDGLRRLQDRYERRSQEQAALDALIRRLSLSRLYRLAAGDADSAATFPIATPLALRIGRGLRQADATGWASLRRDITTDLRVRVERETGIRIPGVRLTETPMIGPGDYVILIDDEPVASGTLPTDGHFVLQQDLGQQPVGRRSIDPLSGQPGTWIEGPQGRLADVPHWRPLGFVARHLEATVRRGLACFIRSDDVRAWLDRSPEDESAAARIILPDRSARVMLSRVLQTLAREGIPLTTPTVVLQAMQRAPQGASALEIAAAVRQQLRSSLPGNAPGNRRVVVPKPLEERLAAGLHREDGSIYWELPRDEAAQLLGALRDIDPERLGEPGTALVVGGSEVRPFLWRLVTADFPYLSVLSQEEVIERDGEAN
jgi:tetratricopeptide (TPR) repeat protein